MTQGDFQYSSSSMPSPASPLSSIASSTSHRTPRERSRLLFSRMFNRREQALYRRTEKTLTKLLDHQPFTVRGALTLMLAAWILLQFGVPTSDLVAAVLGGGFIFLVLLLLVGTVVCTVKTRRTVKAEHRIVDSTVESHRELPSQVQLSGISLIPYFALRVERVFEHGPIQTPIHILKGTAAGTALTLTDSIKFPHRGVWNLVGLRFTLGDAFGMTALSWQHAVHTPISVDAPTLPIRPLPIVASSSRSGDEISLTRERAGDPFDLKAYDPSDGINRILWKTFAKSGDLVVRRPEPAVVPEGEMPMFVIASKLEDEVASAAQDYVHQLQSQNITVLLAVDGAAAADLVTSERAVRDRLNSAAFHPNAGSAGDFMEFVGRVQSLNPYLSQIVVFVGETNWQQMAALFQRSPLHVSLVVVPVEVRNMISGEKRQRKIENRMLSSPAGIDLHFCEIGEQIRSAA